jgi:hypothetical protein
VRWAREETHLKQLFRESFTLGRSNTYDVMRKLKQMKKHLLVVAVYSRDAMAKSELTFEEGDTILVLEKDPSGWWTGQHQENGRIGIFPANHSCFTGGLRRTTGTIKRKTSSGGTSGGTSGRKSPSPKRKGLDEVFTPPRSPLKEDGKSNCSVCKDSFDESSSSVSLGGAVVHEGCVGALLAKNKQCFICKAVDITEECNQCVRNVCKTCCVWKKCKVCNWVLGPRNGEALETFIALRSHTSRCKNEMSFQKGDDIEVMAHTDFGWVVGRTNLSYGLFPASLTAPIVKKFSLRRIKHMKNKQKITKKEFVEAQLPKDPQAVVPVLELEGLEADRLPKQAQTPRTPLPKLPQQFVDEIILSSAYSTIMTSDDAQMTAQSTLTKEEELVSDCEEDSVESEISQASFDEQEDLEESSSA